MPQESLALTQLQRAGRPLSVSVKVGRRQERSSETQETAPWLLKTALLMFEKMKSILLVVAILWVATTKVDPLTGMGPMRMVVKVMRTGYCKARVEVAMVAVATKVQMEKERAEKKEEGKEEGKEEDEEEGEEEEEKEVQEGEGEMTMVEVGLCIALQRAILRQVVIGVAPVVPRVNTQSNMWYLLRVQLQTLFIRIHGKV